MTSCGSKKVIIEKQITNDSLVETAKDTIIKVEKDSSSYDAELGVDDKGKVIIKQVNNTTSGRKLKAPKVSIIDNKLSIDCEAQAEEKFLSWKETFIKSYKETNKPIITNSLTWWQQTQIYIARTALALLALWILLLIFKFKKI